MKLLSLALFAVLTGCQQTEEIEQTATTGTETGSTSTVTSTGTTTSTSITDECSDYRATYPTDGYGTAIGSVMADFPGMVDGAGNPQTLTEFYADTSKHVLVIANAFDT
jgi:hypothetical protein